MKNFILFSFVVSLSSCATIFNKPDTIINVHTKSPAVITTNNDTLQTTDNVASFMVPRKKEPLKITSITDSITKSYSVKSIYSHAYLSNFFLYYGIPGFIIDQFSTKRFGYPEHILINPADSTLKYKKLVNYNHKGEFYLNMSIPEFNFLNQYTRYTGNVKNAGCMGISGGFDYYHKPLQFVNVTGAIALTFEAPFPLPLEYFGPHDYARTSYISISNNHRFYFISYGYGLSFSENTWKYFGWNYDVTKKNYAIGFVFPAYIKLGPIFNLGFIYRPSFYRPYSPQPFKYEHLMSVDFAWKFKIK